MMVEINAEKWATIEVESKSKHLKNHFSRYSKEIWLSLDDAQSLADYMNSKKHNFAIHEWAEGQEILANSYEYTIWDLDKLY